MSVDEQHVAFPKLYKAPAYARPPAPVDPSDRPFDLDEMPLLAEQTPEERSASVSLVAGITLAGALPPPVPAGAYVTPPSAPEASTPPSAPEASTPERPTPEAPTPDMPTPEAPASGSGLAPPLEAPAPTPDLAPRPFSLRALADRLRGRSD